MNWFDSGFHFDLAVLAIVAVVALWILIGKALKAIRRKNERLFLEELAVTFDAVEVDPWEREPEWRYTASPDRPWWDDVYEEAS